MTNLIMLCFFLVSLMPTSFLIYGVHILFQEDHLLEKQGEWITEKVGEKWSKPLVNCPICMSSVWGTLAYVVLMIIFNPPISAVLKAFLYPCYLLCLCGLNYIINKLISKNINATIVE